jgi:hypothetical protein
MLHLESESLMDTRNSNGATSEHRPLLMRPRNTAITNTSTMKLIERRRRHH